MFVCPQTTLSFILPRYLTPMFVCPQTTLSFILPRSNHLAAYCLLLRCALKKSPLFRGTHLPVMFIVRKYKSAHAPPNCCTSADTLSNVRPAASFFGTSMSVCTPEWRMSNFCPYMFTK